MDPRLVELEVKITHQERLVATLNEVITQQQVTVEALARRLERVEHQLQEKGDQGASGAEPPPPHY